MSCVNPYAHFEEYMKYLFLFITLLASIATAEKYGMIFGTAEGWRNYPVYSVFFANLILFIAHMPSL